jgi:CO dehydrogenase maturation factor
VALGAFRKSTPPKSTSNFVIPHLSDDYFANGFCTDWRGHLFAQVGTYEEDQVGTSCYLASLAVFENVLSHMIDTRTLVISDMVAGTDAFSNTLHTQFDLLVLVVEPTIRSIEVYKKYNQLANHAGISNHLVVVGNKVMCQEDKEFLESHVDKSHIIGYLGISKPLSKFDRTGTSLTPEDTSEAENQLMQKIYETAKKRVKKPNDRLKQIINIHKGYIKKDFVTERYGDVSNQIDESFDIEQIFNKYA